MSLRLQKQLEDGVPLDLLLPVSGRQDWFAVSLGGAGSPSIDALMTATRPEPGVIEFSRVFLAPTASGEQAPFTLKKRYEFVNGD